MRQALPAMPADVRDVIEVWPAEARAMLHKLRALIFEVAALSAGVGQFEEALRWGEPAYLPSQTRSGSAVRLGWKPTCPEQVSIYFHSRTGLVDTLRTLFPHQFVYAGRRAIVLGVRDPFDRDALAVCI